MEVTKAVLYLITKVVRQTEMEGEAKREAEMKRRAQGDRYKRIRKRGGVCLHVYA